MNNNSLFFHRGEGKIENQRFSFNSERTVVIKDACSELVVEGIRDIELSQMPGSTVKIKIGAKVSFYPLNKKIAINDIEGRVVINTIYTDDQLKEFESMADAQRAKGLIDYIHENVPNLYTRESLSQKNLSELIEIKEKMEDLANSY